MLKTTKYGMMRSNSGRRSKKASPSKRSAKLTNSASAVASASCVAIRRLRKVRFERRIISLTVNKKSRSQAIARPLIAHPAHTCQPSWLGGIPRCRVRPPRARPKHHAARDAHAQHVNPSLIEIEDVRIEQRGENILHHDHQPDPGCETFAPEQQQMQKPHRVKRDDADRTPLDRNVQGLIVRICDHIAAGENFRTGGGFLEKPTD